MLFALAAGYSSSFRNRHGAKMLVALMASSITHSNSRSAQAALSSEQLAVVLRDNLACAPWSGPYGGVPPFDRISLKDLGPALYAGMAAQLAEIALIADSSAAPSFDNTIAAYQRSGQALGRAQAVFSALCSSISNEALRALEEQIEPKLAQHKDLIVQNEKFFARVEAVHAGLDAQSATLTPEQRRLVTLIHNRLVRCGARLQLQEKEELSRINQKLATLYTRFSQNVLKAEAAAVFIENEAELQGVPNALKEAMARAAADLGRPASWAIVNTRSIIEPLLTYSPCRELRQRAFELFASRADGGEHNNNPIISEIVSLRAQRAKLLGFATHAHLQLEETMATQLDTTATFGLTRSLRMRGRRSWKPAVRGTREWRRSSSLTSSPAAICRSLSKHTAPSVAEMLAALR